VSLVLSVRAVVRFGASLLGKVVDSLAPSITSILVRGKQVCYFKDVYIIYSGYFPCILRDTIHIWCTRILILGTLHPMDMIRLIMYNKMYTYVAWRNELIVGLIMHRLVLSYLPVVFTQTVLMSYTEHTCWGLEGCHW